MATRYFKTAATTWNSANNWSATSAGGADNAGVPTAADDVIFSLLSGNCQIDVNAVCRSIDTTSGVGTYGGTITYSTTSITLTIGDATAGAGSVALKLNAGVTYTAAITNTMTFVSTSTTLQSVTTGSLVMPNMTFNGAGGKWQFADGFTNTAQTTTLVTGTLDFNGKTFSISAFSMTGSATRTVTFGAASITLGLASSSAFNGGSSGGATVTANTGTINLTGAGSGFNSGAQNWNGLSVNLNGSGAGQFTSNGTIKNLTRNGTAVVSDTFIVTSSFTISGTLTVAGQSTANRVLMSTNIVGTVVTVTVNGTAPTLSNTDFMDITAAGTAGTWSGTSLGNALGNSNITFTTPVTRYAVAAGSWSQSSVWSTTTGGGGGSSSPICHDTVFIDGNSGVGTISINVARACADLDCTNYAGTLNFTAITAIYGSLTLNSTMTFATNGNVSAWNGRSSHTITSATKTFANSITVNAFGGTYTFADAFSQGGGSFNHFAGTLSNTNNVAIGFGAFACTGSITRVLNMGTSQWSIATNTAGGTWSVSGSGLTLNASTSTIAYTLATSNNRTFIGGGFTYGTLIMTVAGNTGSLTLTGSNTFNDIKFSDASNARSLLLTSGTTTTITSVHGLRNVIGTSGKLMSVTAVTAASAATIDFPNGYGGGTDFLSVKDITATTNTLYAGRSSTNVSGNTNVTFTGQPATSEFFLVF